MKRVVMFSFMTFAALMATALTGCVTEEVPTPKLHTSAYVGDQQPDAPSLEEARAHNASSSGGSSSTASSGAAAPVAGAPVVSAPPPPIATLPPPPSVRVP